MSWIRMPLAVACAALWVAVFPEPAPGQDPARGHDPAPAQDAAPGEVPAPDSLPALVAEAMERNPRIAATTLAAVEARERVSQAGAWEDPLLTVGFINLRTTSFDFGDDFMTMKVFQLGQQIPIPGKLGARREVAERLTASREQLIEAERVAVAAEVKRAYAELYYLDRALEITDRNRTLLLTVRELSLTTYATGRGRQPDVLRAGLEVDELEQQRVGLAEGRRAAVAHLNSLLDRPPDRPVGRLRYPADLRQAARPVRGGTRWGAALRYAAEGGGGALGGEEPGAASAVRVRPGRLPPLDSLIERALRVRPQLRAHIERIAADEARVRLARRSVLPDPQLNLGYGQRDGFPDMLNATVSFRLPIFAGAKQNAAVREARASLARNRAEHESMVNDIERSVTEAYARLLDVRERLAILDQGVVRRARANLEAALGAYRSGAADFLTLLDAQTSLFEVELRLERGLADFLAAWAELERAVGEEIEP